MIDVECVLWNHTYYRCSACLTPLFRDVPLAELQRLYEWRKANYKGKIKEEI